MHDKPVISVFQDVIHRKPVFDESVFALADFYAVKVIFGNRIYAAKHKFPMAIIVKTKLEIFNVDKIFAFQTFGFFNVIGKIKVRE